MNDNLRACQLVQLRILRVVDDLCKKHGLRYFLYAGTLLGAMRHDGFIPWDDDLDIGMPIEDYRRFIRIAKKELPAGFSIHTPDDAPHIALAFTKVRDDNSFFFEIGMYRRTLDPTGIFIDVFPFERTPKIPVSVQRLWGRAARFFWLRQRVFLDKSCDHVLLSPVYSMLAILCWILHGALRLSYDILKTLCPAKSVCESLETENNFQLKEEWLLPVVYHRFEDGEFPIPKDADACLRTQFGDWHWIPPPEKRPQHSSIIDPCRSAKAYG